MPAGEVRASDITDLPARPQVVQGSECLLYRGIRVETVHMINVDMIRVQSSQARLARLYQMETEEPMALRLSGLRLKVAFVEIKRRFLNPWIAFPKISSERPLE